MSEAAFGRARELASWKERVRAGFEGVHIDHIDLDVSVADIGVDRGAEAVVALGSLTPDDVEVQLLHGPVGQGEELADPAIVPMALAGDPEDVPVRYPGPFPAERQGRSGATAPIVSTIANTPG